MASNVRPGASGASAGFPEELSDLSPQLVLDMGADDVVERRFPLEAEREAAARIEAAWPAGDDALNQFVRCTLDESADLVAGDAAQRRDLFPDLAPHTRHGDIDAVAQLRARQAGCVDEKSNRRARAGMPMQHAVGDRQDRFLSVERLPNDAGEETRRCFVRFARPHHDRWQSDPDAFEKAAPRIISQQQFADRLLRAVGSERREMEFFADRFRKRRAEYRDR